MELLWKILIYLSVFAAFIAAVRIVSYFINARNLARFDNYDRSLSIQDQKYIEQAVIDLETAASIKNPKWYAVVLYTGFLPAMFLSWAVLGAIIFCCSLLMNFNQKTPDDLIINTGGDYIGILISISIGGLFLAAAALYAFSIKIPAFSNYVALNSNVYGFDKDSVRAGLLAKLEHKIRSREQHSSSKFNADKFLTGVNQSYRDGCMKGFYGCLAIGLILTFFDLRSETSFYKDRVVSSGDYFSIAPKQTVAYTDVTSVALECYFSDNNPRGNYYVFEGDKKLAEVTLARDNIKEMAEVDDILRGQSHIVFKSHKNKKGQKRLSATCIGNLGAKLDAPDLVLEILKFDK